MERIGKLYRERIEKSVAEKLSSANGLFVVRFSGLKSCELTEFRNKLSQTKSRFFVSKNSLVRRALKEADFDNLVSILEGQAGVIFSYEDPISTCKTIHRFSKDHTALEFQGGVLEKRLILKSDLASLVSLPSKEGLQAKVVSCLAAPINNFVFILSGILREPVNVLDAIKNKKGGK